MLWAKHVIKLEKESISSAKAKQSKELREEILHEIEEKIEEVKNYSNDSDEKIWHEVEGIKEGVDNLTAGMLSLQGREFKDFCRQLLQPEHEITVYEYEDFESEYNTYKLLKGNHKGDTLHDRVVEKYAAQISKAADK